jgi:hypothetical protein
LALLSVAVEASSRRETARLTCSHEIEFSFLKANLVVLASDAFISREKLVQQSRDKIGWIERASSDGIGDAEICRSIGWPDRCLRTMEIIMEIMTRRVLISAMLSALFGSTAVFAQVGGAGIPTPGISATSPLGMTPGSPVAPTGIPMGATELASPGLAPATTGPMTLPGFGNTCSAIARAATTEGSGTSSVFDGGGIGVGTSDLTTGIGAPVGTGTTMGTGTDMGMPMSSSTGTAAICGTNGTASSSSSAMSSPSPSGAMRTGIPLGSVEMGNAGVSPLIVVPTPSASSSTLGTTGMSPTTGIMPPMGTGVQ